MSEPTYAVLDVETTMKCPVGENKANPFWPENSVVMRGYKPGDDRAVTYLKPWATLGASAIGRERVRLLVGHHIGFDIHHLRVKGEINEKFLGTVNLWDTQVAEYLLTAQRTQYASLDELATKYGGTLKDDTVKKLFAAGKGADEIDKDILTEYLKGDLLNTELVFFRQFEEAQRQGLVPLIITQMDALAATIEMTYNGLKVDQSALLAGATALRIEVDAIEAELIHAAGTQFGWPDRFNPGSAKQMSTLLFGGEHKYKVKKMCGFTRAGKEKWKYIEVVHKAPALFILPREEWKNSNGYSTDDKVLNELAYLGPPGACDFAMKVLEYRDKNKQLTTYWEGLLKLLMPDGCIHHKLNHTVTRTGRLSSSEPNLQNVTNGDIKKVFVSRWGEDGVIVEADFKQLEMVELAIVSGDKQLLKDIEDGVDMHDALFQSMYRRKMEKEERKHFKRCSFCLVYGGGKKAIAQQGNISEADAQRFIDTFYTRYKGVKEYHDYIINLAESSRVNHGLKDSETGLPVGEFTYTNEHTKRQYWFREYPTDWGTINFSPSELKNYMVQGGATGDKVPLCIGKLYRVLRNHPTLREKCLLINTVHDSVLFDVHKDVIVEALKLIKETMERTPEFYEEAFGYKMPLPLKVELSAGPNWLDQHEIKFNASNEPLWAEEKAAA